MARDRPSPYGEGGDVFYRSAGACPPRSLECADDGEGQALALRWKKETLTYRSAGALGCHTRSREGFHRERPVDRSMARDRPSPYGEGVTFFIVARGPVPRERPIDRSMARDRPSPYGNAGSLTYRSAGALGCHTRIQAGFPRVHHVTSR